MLFETRYMVGHRWAEGVSDTTALPHRILRINDEGDLVVHRIWKGEESGPIHQISPAELRFLAQQSRRAAAKRFWARITGKR